MTAWAAGAWATGAWQGTAWQSAAPAIVPDVVGLAQTAAIALLQADGFVVVVETAASSTVAAGVVISQMPAAGSASTSGATVTITVSTGEEDILSAKFLGYPNVRRRGLQREEPPPPPPSEPLPAEVTNMPDASPAPKPELLARGVVESAIDHAAPEPVPEIPVPTVKAAPKLALVAAAPAPTPEPESPAPEPLAAVQQVETAAEETARILRAKTTEEIAKVVEGTLNALGERIGGLIDQVEMLQKSITETQRIAALEKRNRARAEAIARKLLNDGEKDA